MQEMQLLGANGRFWRAFEQIRQLDPNWRPRTSSLLEPNSNHGVVEHANARAKEAEERLSELLRFGIGANGGPPLDPLPSRAGPIAPPWSKLDGPGWIDAYRLANTVRDLFGNPTRRRHKDTVAVTMLNGLPIFGVNSRAPMYTEFDRRDAMRLRQDLVLEYPDVMNAYKLGLFPNNALSHAEVTVLLRAARENGGTLAGQTLEVNVDGIMCNNCKAVLEYVAAHLGNPTVSFTDKTNTIMTIHNGHWLNGRKR